MKGYTVATGNVNPLIKNSRKAMEFIKKQDGFVGAYPMPPRGTLWVFKTKSDAIRAKNCMDAEGIRTGTNICEIEYEN